MREYFSGLKTPFHIYNRGTEKRVIFTDYGEYCRFVFLMWVCRIGSPGINLSRGNVIGATEAILRGEEPDSKLYTKEHEPLITFITWNLLSNHFHFILVSLVDNGIAKYMSKLGNAYTKYFNARHQRSGRLFQSSYQSIEIKDPKYFYILIKYINLNHAELVEPKWKERRIQNRSKIKKFIDPYIWSAHQDFLGLRQSLLLNKGKIAKLFGTEFTEKGLKGYPEFIESWFGEDFNHLQKYIIEK